MRVIGVTILKGIITKRLSNKVIIRVFSDMFRYSHLGQCLNTVCNNLVRRGAGSNSLWLDWQQLCVG